MRVSVIVPIRNEAANIRPLLLDLARQDYPLTDFEILVIDGQSTDMTRDIVRELQQTIPNLYLFQNPKLLASAARNVGITISQGEFVVIVDGHCRVHDTLYLANMVEAFESSGADTLGRPQPLRADDLTPFQRAVSAARASWLGHNPDSAIYSDVAGFMPPDNVAVAYRRDVFDRVGLFDESFDACEDVEFNTRVRLAGLTCYFTPAITVEYLPRTTLRGLALHLARYGRGRAKLARKHPATLTFASLVPSFWLLWLTAGTIGSLLWPPAALPWLGSVMIYTLVLLAESLRLSRRASGTSFRHLATAFAAIHAGFGWGYLSETTASLAAVPERLLMHVLHWFRISPTASR